MHYLIGLVLAVSAFSASAKDLNTCGVLGQAVTKFWMEYDQARVQATNAEVICQNEKNPKDCVAQYAARLKSAESHFQKARENFEQAGCNEP